MEHDERLLNVAEREMVGQTEASAIVALSVADLQALGDRLRKARDRSRRIANQQGREMRGKAEPRGATPTRENAGTVDKTAVLVEALKRVTAAKRKLTAPTQAQLSRKAIDMKSAAPVMLHPGGRTASTGMKSKPATKATLKVDPREVGRVSKAGKVAQARRDG